MFFTYEEFFAPPTTSAGKRLSLTKEINARLYDTKVYSYSWEDYLEECGSLRVLRNQFRADNVFSKEYKFRNVEWEGYFTGVTADPFTGIHGVSIKMKPTDSVNNMDLFAQLLDQQERARIQGEYKFGEKVNLHLRFDIIGNEDRAHKFYLNKISHHPSNEMISLEGLSEFPIYEFKKGKGRPFASSKKKSSAP